MWLHLAQLLENFAQFASDHRTQQRRLASLGNLGQGSGLCARNKCFGKSLFAWSYIRKIVLGGRKNKASGFTEPGIMKDSGQACLRVVFGRFYLCGGQK